MGPAASANLYQKIIKIAQDSYGAEQDHEFPPMLIYNLPLTGFDETGFADTALVGNQLITGVQKLEQAGSDFIIIACNTVHHFYQAMQNAINIPILSIIDETVERVGEEGYSAVGVLCSESTSKLKLYKKALDKKNIKSFLATKKQQKMVNEVIFHVMSGKQNEDDTKLLKEIMADLCNRGAQSVVLGCTELPLAITQNKTNIELFDSTEIIADAALEFAFSGNNGES